MPPKKEKACPFLPSTPRRKKTTKSFCKEWASKLAESDNDSYFNQQKRLKDDKAPEKPIETTTKSSFMSFLASEAAKQVTKSQEVPCHTKSGRRTVLKVYCSEREASTKTLGSGLSSIFFQGSVELLENVSSKSALGSTRLVRCKNENFPSQITNDAFSTTERIELVRSLSTLSLQGRYKHQFFHAVSFWRIK